MAMIKNYFKTAFRNLLRNKVYSFINIAGLSLGLACAMLIILYLKDEVSYDRFHTNVNSIYRIILGQSGPNANRGQKMGITGFLQGPKFTAKIPEIKSFVRVMGGYEDIKSGADIKGQQLWYADSNFFSVFSFPLLSGNPKKVLSQPNSIVLSEDLAKRQFGTTDAMGKIVLMKTNDQFVPYTVTGIAKRCPQNSSIKFDALLPFTEPAEAANETSNWFSFFLTTYAVVAPHADIKTIEAKMTKVYKEDAQDLIKTMEKQYKMKDQTSYLLQPFINLHLGKDVSQEDIADASDPMFSYILFGIAFFILFIACINFVNLTIARSLKRAKEIGIRKVAGSSRRQLIFQFLGESFILCFAAFVSAIVIVQAVLPVFNQLSNKALALSYLLDVKLVAGYVILFLITGLLAGFYPALVLSGYKPVQTLYSRFTLGGKNYLQKSLVVLQFALASFLIIATFTIFSQFNFLTTEKLGYDDSNLVLVNKRGLTRNEATLLKAELKKDPGIIDVAAKDEGYSFNEAKINGDIGIGFANVTVDESYLPLLKIPIIQGRNFSKDFPSDSSHSVIVNETFVKKAGWKNPIGQQVGYNNSKYSVIAEVKDYHFQSLSQEIVPEMFSMSMQNNYGMAYIKIKPNNEAASLKHIEKTFRKLFPLNSYSYIFKDQENLKNYEAEAKWKQIILFGAILTIFISCIGLFGLSVLSTEKRTKEIGIRKVLGASVSRVASILSTDFLKLVITALLISIPVAWLAANKWLENYPYRITLSWWMFIVAGLLVVFIALATVSFQAIKAAIANPVKSLRTE
jgi:putative ABC transport system permease protein